MRLWLLALVVLAACGGQQRFGTTQCLRGADTGGDGKDLLGCLRPELPLKIPLVARTKMLGVFAQRQDNEQQCLYAKRVPIDFLMRQKERGGHLPIATLGAVDGDSKALSAFSVAEDDVYTALRALYAAAQLGGRLSTIGDYLRFMLFGGAFSLVMPHKGTWMRNKGTCRDPVFLYRNAGDAFSAGKIGPSANELRQLCGDKRAAAISAYLNSNDPKLTAALQTTEQIFSGKTAAIVYNWKIFPIVRRAQRNPIVSLFQQNNGWRRFVEQSGRVHHLKRVTSWIHSEGASACRKQISI